MNAEPRNTVTPYSTRIKLFGGLGLMTAALMWGSTFPAGKYALQFMSPFYLMAFRFLLAFVLMAALFSRKLLNAKPKELRGGMYAGLALFGGYFLQIYGLQFTTAGKQSFLAAAYVVFVPFLTWVAFKRCPSARAYLGTAVCFFGVSLISLTERFTISLGDSLTLISSSLYAVHIVVTGYYAQRQEAGVFTAVQFGVCGVLAMLVAIPLDPIPTMALNGGAFSVIYLAIFGSLVAYYLQTVCQKYVKPSTTSIILSTEAVFGSLLSVVLLGDPFSARMALGAGAILGSIWICEGDDNG